ncbi:peptide deformylase [Saccharothrix variisporea]|uniref:Peptide deformylase n=1 Tax=Saccharothrix variisporea TaxID=543527 RepID=A0A495X2S2_9PSEU|nr:peptide deformylase [Saccharothrix variisporea]RKT67545.1 peptide deformylase [Saccharothrix variisporea]
MKPIVLLGQPVLHTPTRPVTEFDDDLRELVDAMFATMAAAPGAGLAANQVGVDLRVFVYDCGRQGRGCVVNPRVERLPGGLQDGEEGCLSVPGLAYPTPRAQHVRCTGQDPWGEEIAIEADGFLARCFQHELDHLDGKLYLERLGGKSRRRAERDVKSAPWHGDALWPV